MRKVGMLFRAPMVLAILEVRKFETRRILPFQPELLPDDHSGRRDGAWVCLLGKHGPTLYANSPEDMTAMLNGRQAFRKAEPGDLIWVREAWRVGAWVAEHWARGPGECSAAIAVDYFDGPRKEWLQGDDDEMMLRLMNDSRAEAEKDGRFKMDAEFQYRWPPGEGPCRWRSGIHMPYWANRLTMLASGYRIERLHDIEEDGAISEGVVEYEDEIEDMTSTPSGIPKEVYATRYRVPGVHDDDEVFKTAVAAYADLWDRINGAGEWDRNPWVSVTSWSGVWHRNVLDVEAERSS